MKSNNSISKIEFILFFIFFVILTIPRSINNIFPAVYNIINLFKIGIFLYIAVFCFLKKIKISEFTKKVILYSLFLFFVTIFNKVNPTVFLKVYLLNIAILFLSEVLFNSNYKKSFLKLFSFYFLILLFLNQLAIVYGCYIGNTNCYLASNTYLLGQDNRFILYIIACLIGFYYLIKMTDDNLKYKICFFLTYLVGALSLGILWSVSAFVILMFLGILFIFLHYYKKRIHINFLFYSIIIISILIVFFRIHNLFEPVIVNVLHKSMTLSYRTILWDDALFMLKNSTINTVFGFGYFDTVNHFPNMVFGVSHLHNLIMNVLFFSGIVGLILYYLILNCIKNNIKKIDNNKTYNYISVIFLSLFSLMLFDTFEMYQLYYFILFLFFYSCSIDNFEKHVYSKSLINKIKREKDTVGIMLATYNGEKYLNEQIDSIIKQTYHNWIIFVSDDGSTDNTMKILNDYKNILKNKLIIIDNKEKFLSAKLNFANLFSRISDVSYYMFCDQDDVWDKNKIEKLLLAVKSEEIKNNNLPVLAYCDVKIVDSNLNVINNSLISFSGKKLSNRNRLNHLLVENYFPGCAIMFNKKLKIATDNIYKECEMHDWWLNLTAALLGKIVFVDEPLHLYRQHSNNTIGAHGQMGFAKKIINRCRKLFAFGNTLNTWRNYQNVVSLQAKELYNRYSDYSNDDINTIKKFIKIMDYKNPIKKYCLLVKNDYIPSERIRIFRLIIK